uniref:Carboxylic ester hydrolase n=1 Tax=Streltzoviella insularis TaxID=1206366 RepID=A0A7D5UMR8_9NEOP|nr:carboxylesterase 19 [Streltzoviella insularis]
MQCSTMKCSSVLVAACAALAALAAASPSQEGEERQSRVVPTSEGPVRGYREDNGLYVFYNIPYASVPTGSNRFKAPLPPAIRYSVLDAVDRKIICPQVINMMTTLNNNMQEDCLVANVYIPDTNKTNLPVVVYVHGGGYQIGYGNWQTAKTLVQSKKIIMVSFNYRLAAHGFLCLGTEGAPGNAGMKDQLALLRWIKKNIANFGGNPDDVTIEGTSAGSSAVDLLMLSESALGLFNKVIPESGANVAVWSVQIDPLENAKSFAKTLNFTNVDDLYALEEFYRTIPLEQLFTDTFIDRPDSTFGFSPCVERDTTEEAFLKEAPVDILKQGKFKKFPILYGFANMEGLIRGNVFDVWKEKMNEKFSDFLPADLQFESEKQKEEVAKSIKKFYFGNNPVSKETMLGYVNYFSDIMFTYPHLRSVKLQVEAGSDSIYLYEYSFFDDYNERFKSSEMQNFINNDFDVLRGAYHGAQALAVFDDSVLIASNETSDKVKKMRTLMRELWLNFMINGKPVPKESSLPEWPPVGENWSPHMSLGDKIELRGSLLLERMRFWDAIYEKHYRKPIPPPPPPPPPPRRRNEL